MSSNAEILPFLPPEEEPRHGPYEANLTFEQLCENFRLNLDGQVLKSPYKEFGLSHADQLHGRVVGVEERPAVTFNGHEASLSEMTIEDPYLLADPDSHELMSSHIDRWEGILRGYGYNPHLHRTEPTEANSYNVFTQAWLHGTEMLPMWLWRKTVPFSEALFYISHPDVDRRIFTRMGETGRLSREAVMHLRFAADAHSIRDRGVALEDITIDHLYDTNSSNGTLRWLSLASGAGEPAMMAAKAVMEESDRKVIVTMADIDDKALEHVAQNAKMHSFDPSLLELVRANIINPDIDEFLAKRTGREEQLYDVVDIMGFFEYLKQTGDELPSRIETKMPPASVFAKSAFRFVKPGGIMVTSNMLADRPQLNMLTGIVGWPYINLRSEHSILSVLDEAEILGSPDAKVDLFRVRNQVSDAAVYTIAKVTKLV
jgi:hypothetical protein